MRLTELNPRWITPDIFIFRSPSGRGDWLSCKRVPVNGTSMCNLNKFFYEKCPDLIGQEIVGISNDYCWIFEAGGDFNTLTVTPSIDTNASGNWHGYITNGEIK